MARQAAKPAVKLPKILKSLRAEMPQLQQTYHVESLGIFGPFARGEQTPNSDLGLLIEFHRPPTLFQFVRLQRHLATALGSNVDLVMKSALKPNIGEHILRDLVAV